MLNCKVYFNKAYKMYLDKGIAKGSLNDLPVKRFLKR